MGASRCDVGSHQPVRAYEYRVLRYLATANEPRWVATYHNALDSALDQVEALRANGDTTARVEECAWREVDT